MRTHKKGFICRNLVNSFSLRLQPKIQKPFMTNKHCLITGKLNARLPVKEISILLPAYNEASRIAKCLGEVERAVSSFSNSYELIVAEDGVETAQTAL